MLITLLLFFLFLIIIGLPIAFGMLVSSLGVLTLSGPSFIFVIPQRILFALDSYSLLAVPLFLFAGEVMNAGGITQRIIKFSNSLVGHIKGGMCHVNIVISMVFAGVSGSSTADAAAVSSVLVPSMIKEGYDEDITISVTSASSTIGPIIPPSIPLILYGSLTGLSVGRLFLAGIIPGLLFGLSMMLVSFILSIKRGYPKRKREKITIIIKNFIYVTPALLAPVIILGGIVGGVFTATEAGAVAVFYSLLVSMFYRELSLGKLKLALLKTGKNTSVVLILIACASVLGWIMAINQFPIHISNFLTGLSSNPYIVVFVIIFILLIVGLFIEGLAALTILAPVLSPIVVSLGYDPIQFAMVFLLCISIGAITPPVGILLFTTCGVTNIPLKRVGKTIWFFVLGMLAVTLIIAFFDPLSTYLPSLLMNSL